MSSNQRATFSILATLLGLPLGGCVASEDIATSDEAIIGGNVPAKGALMNWGVVKLSSGCSGVMLTNRHVLTAQHCIRNLEAPGFPSLLPITVTLEKPAGQVDQPVVASTAIEHAEPYSYEHRDYAILVLDAPMSVNDVDDGFYRGRYQSSDGSLLGQTVFCAGYGYTTLATQAGGVWTPGGNGKLTSANQTIDDVWAAGTLIRNVHGGIVGAGGDSGSPCFIQDGGKWVVTGVQSNCPDFDWVNFNDPGKPDFDWSEATAIRQCRGPAPSAFDSMIANNLFTTVTVQYDTLPLVPPGTPATGTLTNSLDEAQSINILEQSNFVVPKSGGVTVDVTSEPPGMMCPHTVHATAPMTGSLSIQRRCLGDGLVAAMLN